MSASEIFSFNHNFKIDMKFLKLPTFLAGLFLISSDSLLGATVAVDWLVFRSDDSGPDRILIGSDDMGNDLVEIRIEKIAGTLVPGSPSTGSLAGESWTSEFPYRDSQGGDASVLTFRSQATGFGAEVNYTVEANFVIPGSGVVFGLGQLFSSPDGGTGAVKVAARDPLMVPMTISEPVVRAGWDNGINRHTLPLQWSSGDQSLAVGGLDPQAQNSEFAFFELGMDTVGQIRFDVPQGYERGSGDVLEFAIGITEPVPEPNGILMIATAWILAMARRQRKVL